MQARRSSVRKNPNFQSPAIDWLPKLKRAIESKSLISAPENLAAYGGDKWFAARTPDAVVLPTSSDEVSKVINFARTHEIPVTTRGAGYGYVGGCVPVYGGIVVGFERMNRILEVSERDFVARVQPGVITGKLQSRAASKGMLYPPDPASLKNSSIGGNIATNAGGPRCLKYGVTRNYVLGLEVVLANGDVVRTGGRVHKNKTGFDLVGIFVGSEGLLGLVTEATLRLLPMPPAAAALSAGFPTMRAAAACVQEIFREGFLPAALEVADRFTLEASRANGRGAQIPDGDAHVLVEIDGQVASVKSELAALARLVKSMGATRIDRAPNRERCADLWELRRGFSESLRATGLTKLNEDIVVPRGRLVDLVAFAQRLEKRCGFPVACFGHAGDGNIHVNVMAADFDNPSVRNRVEGVLDELFQQVLAWGGSITGEHGVGIAKERWFRDAVGTENFHLHQTIKSALDPTGILNPGKFVSSNSV